MPLSGGGDNLHRKAMLVELSRAIAARPFDANRLSKAGAAIKDSLGEGALIEAAGVAAGIEAASRCVDMVGKPPLPAAMAAIIKWVLYFISWIVSFFQH